MNEILWSEFEVVDVRLAERWLAGRPADARPAASPSSAPHRARHVYFDTARRALLRAGFTLRISLAGRRSRAELVRLGRTNGEFAEDVGSDPEAALARADGPVGSRVRLLAGAAPLRPLVELRLRESRLALRDGDILLGELVLCSANVPLEGARRPVRLERLRIERAPGVLPERLQAFAAEMRASAGARDAGSGLFEAALAARGVRMPPAPNFGTTTIAAGGTLGETAYAVLRSQFAALLAKDPGTRLGDDAEDLHDMRVATRRLRAAMRLFHEALPSRAERLRDDLGWIAAALGEVRDLDVQAEQLAEWTARDPRLRAAVADAALHVEARRRLVETLDSIRYRRFVRAFGTMLRAGPPARNPAAARPIVAAAPLLVRALRRKVRKSAARLSRESPPAAFHDLRIREKRFRYALEFLEEIYGGAAKDLARRIAEVQDLLGRHQDACVAVDRIERRLAAGDAMPPTAAFAMGVVVERCSQEAARLRAEFPQVYERTEGRPWRRLRRRMERMLPAASPPKPRRTARAAAVRKRLRPARPAKRAPRTAPRSALRRKRRARLRSR